MQQACRNVQVLGRVSRWGSTWNHSSRVAQAILPAHGHGFAMGFALEQLRQHLRFLESGGLHWSPETGLCRPEALPPPPRLTLGVPSQRRGRRRRYPRLNVLATLPAYRSQAQVGPPWPRLGQFAQTCEERRPMGTICPGALGLAGGFRVCVALLTSQFSPRASARGG